MIRYGSANYHAPVGQKASGRAPVEQVFNRDPLKVEYRQLLNLRELVRRAEAEASKRRAVAVLPAARVLKW
jgi:hypothetical protein